MNKEIKKYNIEGDIIIVEIINNWHYVYADKNKACCKSFGSVNRDSGDSINANIGMQLYDCIRIVAAKIKGVYPLTPDYKIAEVTNE